MVHQDHASSQNLESGSQVRGKDLKSQMKESAEKGENFRAENQGADQIEGQNNTQGRNQSSEK